MVPSDDTNRSHNNASAAIGAGHEVLASPGFWSDLRSGREPERLHLIAVLSFDDEFREDVA